MKTTILVILFFTSINYSQSTYYVSSNRGNDVNPGDSELKPWKTLTKVNSVEFKPGDKILFECNNVWEGEELIINNSGSTDNKIIYSSYGIGEKPIISSRSALPSWKKESSWTPVAGFKNIWKIDLVHDFPISRIWLNGIEANMAYDYKIRDYVPQGRKLIKGDNGDGTQGVCETHQFYSDRTNSFFYLYSTSNPAFFYKEILIPSQISEGKVQRNTIEVNADYITLKNIEVQGGMYASIALNGADFLIVDNCHIGKYSNWSGILGDSRKKSDKTSDFVTISNSVINSDWNYMYAFYTQETPYGIAIVNGANHWEIYNNIILDWWMNLFIAGKEDACQYINIYNNEIAGPRNTFSKAMQIISGGDWGTPSATYVNFYNNYIHDVVFGIQISSSNNKFFYNVFDNLNLTSINEHAFGAGGWASQMIGDEIHANTSDNYFINNTYHNLLNFANLYTGSNHFNLNNMYVNCGTSRNGIATRVPKDANGTWQNNLLFFDGFTLNSDIIAIQNVNNYTIGAFNALNGQFDKVISGNLQHVGTLSALINNDFSLPNGSPALNAGVDITSYVPEGFTDRHGNLVNRKSPNIGAFASSSSTSESNPLTPSSSNIEILSPNGGESWVANSSHELKWISSSNISQVHIFYSTDNGENWDQISSVENKGSFSWLIPEINSANCLIRVKDADDFSVFDKSDKPFTITANESSSSSDKVLKIFLEATFNNDKMNTELSKTFEIPKEQPYNSSPWSVINTSKLNSINAAEMVDWVLVELRSEQKTKNYSKPGILTKNGIVKNIDGTNFSFSNINSGNYYITILHRNHLSIMSSNKIQVNNNESINYDFTDSQLKGYGTNPMVSLGNGKFGLYAGDSDANGIINNLDFGIVANNIPFKGYANGDLDMNGIVNVLDYSYINKNILKRTQVP